MYCLGSKIIEDITRHFGTEGSENISWLGGCGRKSTISFKKIIFQLFDLNCRSSSGLCVVSPQDEGQPFYFLIL